MILLNILNISDVQWVIRMNHNFASQRDLFWSALASCRFRHPKLIFLKTSLGYVVSPHLALIKKISLKQILITIDVKRETKE